MFDLTLFQSIVLLVCAFLVGFSKTAGTSLSSVIIPIMVDAFPAKEATGILSLAFFFATFHAVYHYRHYVRWHYFPMLAPGVITGLFVGTCFMQDASNDSIKLIIGMIILTMLAFNAIQSEVASSFAPKKNFFIASLFGMVIGFSSVLANSGSPILAIYLLMQKEDKFHLIGTLSVFFFFVDVIKIPINLWSEVVTYTSLKLSLVMMPLMIVGGFAGIAFLRWISNQQFRRLVEWLSFAGGIKLVFRPLMNLL
ncbi:TSUP family transporter [Candidatus Berkiella aquae]|uniref:Probable membrane transporter protein n=1 Tax=Candidatus Berkiella aquae TaxID=295108 RepID=A0A0Q9YPL9_9GAMM|nr:sulfite exporter TauE/SafE family protein [Candidatus Berkiella aquae]MCS5709942.1 sulfite exporter TauE/SafE family protein [Candidatus Berkiella aquae]